MSSRRRFITALGLTALAAPLATWAQQPKGLRRIAVLTNVDPQVSTFRPSLENALHRIGYEAGRNLAIDWRFGEAKAERLPALARELVGMNPALIVAHSTDSIAAVQQATHTIPVVMHTASLPVEDGFVQSLARPGGNITGTAFGGVERMGKILQTLKEAAPGAVRVAALWNSTFPFEHLYRAEFDRAASFLGITLQYFPISKLDEVEPAMGRIAAARPDALLVVGGPLAWTRAREIATFAIARKLVSISPVSTHVEHGGLLYYGPDLLAIFDRTASFVDRILRGAKPADLPVELPRKYELVINMKTARAIGHKIPTVVLVRADRVIE